MNNPIYQTPIRHRSSAAEFRLRARTALAGRWELAIGVFVLLIVISSAPSLVGSIVAMAAIISSGLADMNPGQLDIGQMAGLLSVGWLALMLFSLAYVIFVAGPLQAGYASFQLGLLDKKQETGVRDLFFCFRPSNRRYWRTVGVMTLYSLVLYAAAMVTVLIPGLLAVVLDVGGMLDRFPALLFALASFTVVWFLAGMAVLAVLFYQYSLCPYIVVEYPQLGAADVLRNSRLLMRGNKWRLFCTQLSFIGWGLLASCCTCGLGYLVLYPYFNETLAAFYDEVSQRAAAREVEFPSVNPEDYLGK